MADSGAPTVATRSSMMTRIRERYLQPYHVGNLFLSLIYIVLRLTPLSMTVFELEGGHLDANEMQTLSILGVVLAIKSRRAGSTDAMIDTSFLFFKVTTAYLFFQQSVVHFVLYGAACTIMYILFPSPTLGQQHAVTVVNPGRLENILQERAPKVANTYVLLMLSASWSPPCNLLAREYAELADSYSRDHLRFLKLDVGRFPVVATQYNVNTDAMSKQLPTLILFKNGKEIRRRPRLVNGRVYSCRFASDMIERDFELSGISRGDFANDDIGADEDQNQDAAQLENKKAK